MLTFPGEALLPWGCVQPLPQEVKGGARSDTCGRMWEGLSLQEEALLKSELHLGHPSAPFLNWLYG